MTDDLKKYQLKKYQLNHQEIEELDNIRNTRQKLKNLKQKRKTQKILNIMEIYDIFYPIIKEKYIIGEIIKMKYEFEDVEIENQRVDISNKIRNILHTIKRN